jgi:hypothetical protein
MYTWRKGNPDSQIDKFSWFDTQNEGEEEARRQDALRKLQALRRFAHDDSQPALVVKGLYIGGDAWHTNLLPVALCFV